MNVAAGPVESVTLIVLIAAGVLILAYTLRTGVPPMPTNPATRTAMLALLPARIDGTIYDLGSGWGGLAIALARRYPDNPVVGIELSPLPYAFARLRLRLRPRPNLSFRRRDFLGEPLADAGAAVCYLMMGMMRALGPKLTAELRPGTVVVCNSFALRDWKPETTLVVPEAGNVWVYRYVAGRAGGSGQAPDQQPDGHPDEGEHADVEHRVEQATHEHRSPPGQGPEPDTPAAGR